MAQERRTAAPAKETAAPTAKNLADEVHSQSRAALHSALMHAVRDRLAPLVVTEIRNPADHSQTHYRTRTYLTLAAAERAVLAAWDRGQRAEVVLVRLLPVQIGGDL